VGKLGRCKNETDLYDNGKYGETQTLNSTPWFTPVHANLALYSEGVSKSQKKSKICLNLQFSDPQGRQYKPSKLKSGIENFTLVYQVWLWSVKGYKHAEIQNFVKFAVSQYKPSKLKSGIENFTLVYQVW